MHFITSMTRDILIVTKFDFCHSINIIYLKGARLVQAQIGRRTWVVNDLKNYTPGGRGGPVGGIYFNELEYNQNASFLFLFDTFPPKNYLVINRGRRLKRGGVENREDFRGG